MADYTLETSPIWSTITRIREGVGDITKEKLTANIHLAKESVPVLKVVALDVVEDYVNKVGSLINIQIQMGLGDYVKRIYPERDLIEMTVWATPVTNVGAAPKSKEPVGAIRYKVIFKPDDNPHMTASGVERLTITELNLKGIVTLNLQLIPVQTEMQRLITVPDNTYTQTKIADYIHAIMLGYGGDMYVDGERSCDGVDVIKPDNQDLVKVIMLPSGIHLSAIPTWLQTKGPGVYTTGIGTFFKRYRGRWTWFVYPLFRFKIDAMRPNAIFYAVPEKRFSGELGTWVTSGNLLEAMVTGERSYKDSAEVDTLNKGNGFKLSDPRAIINEPVKIDTATGKVTTTADENNHDVVTSTRRDGAQYAPNASKRISVNSFNEYSQVAARSTGRIDFNWENGDIDLLYPGMPCTYVYLDKNVVKTVVGTLLFAHAVYSIKGQIHASDVHHRNVMITMATQTIKIEVNDSERVTEAATISI